MRRTSISLIIAVAFGAGLTIGLILYFQEKSTSVGILTLIADLNRQISDLQSQISTNAVEMAETPVEREDSPKKKATEIKRTSATVGPVPTESQSSPEEPKVEASDVPESEDAEAPPPLPQTEEAALGIFYQFLDKTEGMGRRGIMEHVPALLADLREIGEPAAAALIQVIQEGEDNRDRRIAARLLGALKDPRGLPVLENVLQEEEDVVMRRAAVRGLQLMQTPEAIPVLETILSNSHEDRYVRMRAAYGLAQLGKSEGTSGLVQIFDEADADGRGRFLAFRAITTLDNQEIFPLMRKLTASGNEISYRLKAMKFLTEHEDKASLPILQQVMQSPDEQPSIREAAEQAYLTIAGDQ